MPTINTQAMPPSPSTSAASFPSPISGSVSDDDYSNLSDSWLEIETSSIGPSTLDGLSDSSYEGHDHDSRSEASSSSFDEGSADEQDHPAGHDDYVGAPHQLESDTDSASLSLVGGSYDLASSKLSSRMGSSVDTIQQGLNSTSSSQVRLIFPDPEVSFSSTQDSSQFFLFGAGAQGQSGGKRSRSRVRAETHSAIGDQTDEAAIMKRRSSTPVKGEAWERSSKLWAPDDFSVGEYKLLESTEAIGKWKTDLLKGEVSDTEEAVIVEDVLKDAAAQVAEAREEEVPTMNSLTPTETFKKLPLLALLGLMCALSFTTYSTYGPGFFPASKGSVARTTPVTPSDVAESSLWDRISSLSSSASPAPVLPANTASSSGADYQLLKHALSSLSTAQSIAHSALHAHTTGSSSGSVKTNGKGKQPARAAQAKQGETGVAIRGETSLAVDNTAVRALSRIRPASWGISSSSNASSPAAPMREAPLADCICNLSTYVSTQLLPFFSRSFTQAKLGVVSVVHQLATVMVKELEELFVIFGHLGQTTKATSSLIISRASRGANILHSTFSSLVSNHTLLPSFLSGTNATILNKEVSNLHDYVEHYVETQLDGLAQMIEHETDSLKEKTGQSIRQAKKGLDRVLRDARVKAPLDKASSSTSSSSSTSANKAEKKKKEKTVSSKQAQEYRSSSEKQPMAKRRKFAASKAEKARTKEAQEMKKVVEEVNVEADGLISFLTAAFHLV